MHEVRVDGEERGQDNTRGTTNRSAVCVSPAPEEERKRNTTTASYKTTKQQEKERETPATNLTRVGS